MIQIGDRAKRRSILASTALLPRPLRVAARVQLLSQLELAKARRAKHFIIGHPKSGNTWLRTMISRLYQVEYDFPSTFVLKSDELNRRNNAVPKFLVTNGHYSYEGVIEEALGSPESAAEFDDKTITLLARHPCDIAVSWYIQYTRRTSPAKRELIDHSLERPIARAEISLWDFVMHCELGLRSLIDYLNTWEHIVSRLKHSLIVRYEDLRTEPVATMKRIITHMGEPFTDTEIEDAVAFASFDNLKQLERAGQFGAGGLSRRKARATDSFKVRRGKIHGYRDDFTAEQVAQIDALVETRLSPTLGYASPRPPRVPAD